jgi:hypothetical protein
MDPVTAVGLATNIIQLIQVGRNISTTVKELRRSASGFSYRQNRSAAVPNWSGKISLDSSHKKASPKND